MLTDLVLFFMNQAITLIGYGEAGRTFARAGGWQARARVFDLLDLRRLYDEDDVRGYASLRQALLDSGCVISVVTADQALPAAQDAAGKLAADALFFDMNSVAPNTKRAAAQIINTAGGRYVDVAIMSPVNPAKTSVPLLISGPHCDEGAKALAELGFTNIRIVGDAIGRAATIKMLRSVMYKGVEALTAECLIACERAGVTDEVLGSFNNDWSAQADYRLDRMLVHGARRSAEMAEAVKTLEALGVEPLLTRGTVARQAALGALNLESPPSGLDAKLKAIAK
ncbi:DUF1932 domain-containing protein [Parasphingorhabdus sp.]|uniref:NAD(P)-dependent oxidoreductase n=1 Tax=Parasphingorhabdus sp. TaxID=2709688 RepID=UPI003A8F70F5